MKVAIIIPCYNSEGTIYEVVKETTQYMKKMKETEVHIVLVNDFSKDNTFGIIRKIVEDFDNVIGVDLAKNAGQHNALLAGMRQVEADYYIGMDDDMQTHPSQIYILFEKLFEGYDVVYGTYEHKKASNFRKLGSWFNNYTVAKMLGKPKEMKISSFWLIRRFVRDYVVNYNSKFTNLQGLFLRSSAKVTNVKIKHFERKVGVSNYTIKKLLVLWSSVLNYSIILLRAPLVLGGILVGISGIHIIVLIIMYLFKYNINYSIAILVFLLESIGGCILFFEGLLGEYIGRMFLVETRDPQSVIREIIKHKETKEQR